MDLLVTMALAVAATPAAATPVESFIEAAGPSGTLKGTMLSPGADSPVVLIIPGSGPTDRDGNSPLGVKAGTYRLLAKALAGRGIATVRIDKRGMFASGAAAADANAVTIPDYAADVRSWTAAIRAETGVPCVWLLGHSEGGLVALVAAADAPEVCGLVLVSTPGRLAGTVLRHQLRSNPANAPLLEQAFAAIDQLEAGNRVDTAALHPALIPLFALPVQGFVISLFSYDPAKLASVYRRPMLILQGAEDLQVTKDDAQLLKAANPDAKLVIIGDANHVLKSVPAGNRAANAASYADPALPLAPGVAEAIADFIEPNAQPSR